MCAIHALAGTMIHRDIELKLGLYQSDSFHPASQTKIGLPPAVRMLYWLLLSPRKLNSNKQQLAMKEGEFLKVAGGKGASQQHRH
jgi:hypothetical protein